LTSVLVTGAAGFIGSHASEHFLNRGCRVLGIDNFDPWYDRRIKEANLAAARAHASFEFAELDLCDLSSLRERVGSFEPDLVIHLAGRTGVRPSVEDPLAYVHANYEATVNVLEVMREVQCGRFVFGSSSSVYGGSTRVPFAEDEVPDTPISPYAATKRACELMNHVYHDLHGFSIANLRFFTVYGPRQRPDLAIHRFTRRIDAGQPVTLYGDGSSSRDYTYVSDIIDGIDRASQRLFRSDLPVFETYNLGESRPIVLIGLVRTIERELGRSANIEWLPPQPGDMPQTHADITRARRDLGYRPSVGIEEGIRRFAEWYREHRTILSNTAP
jgi:nucleoside-diphosphate-sugar epimerase